MSIHSAFADRDRTRKLVGMMRKIARTFAVATIVVAVIAIAFILGDIGWNITQSLKEEARHSRNIADVLFEEVSGDDLRNIATALVIAGGVSVAWYKLDIFREFEPHLSIEQTIESRRLGNSFRLIVATAILTNNSKVLVKPRKGYCRLAQTAPLSDPTVVEIFTNAVRNGTEENGFEQFGWPLLGEVKRTWPEGDIAIEPGECHRETYQFIVDEGTESVVALTAIYNPAYNLDPASRAETWRCYTFHDVQSSLSGSNRS